MSRIVGRRALCVLLMLLVAAAFVVSRNGRAAAQGPRTLVIAIGADQTGMDPQTVQNNESGFVMSTLFDGIVNYKPGSSEVGPGLADSWTISSDGKIYTFKLRRGVKFHDGTPMNARTVAADLDRAINPSNPCYVLDRKVDTYDSFTFGSVKAGDAVKMDVLDDFTLRFTLPKPNAPFLSSLAMVWTGIMSPAATKQYNCDAGQHPVGTGPFKFVEAVRNDHITVDANPDYWGGKPKIDRIIFRIIPESATRLLALERNEVHILADLPPADYQRVEKNSALTLYKEPGLTILGVAMSNDLGPFKDKRVRQAMNYAVDKDAINKGLYGGATTASQGIPPVLWGYNKNVKPYPYDVDRAKALLKDAGYPNGFSTEMMVYANPRGYNPIGGAKLGEAVSCSAIREKSLSSWAMLRSGSSARGLIRALVARKLSRLETKGPWKRSKPPLWQKSKSSWLCTSQASNWGSGASPGKAFRRWRVRVRRSRPLNPAILIWMNSACPRKGDSKAPSPMIRKPIENPISLRSIR